MGCSCSTLQTDKDVVTEMALHLPLRSLFRCRAVCKLWRDVVDSPSFRKLHIRSNKEKKKEDDDDDETVYLQLNYDNFVDVNYEDFVGDVVVGDDVQVSIKMIDTHKGTSLNLKHGFNESFPSPRLMTRGDISKFSGPVKGLICFNLGVRPFAQPLAICNPFLGQIKILPFSPILASSKSSCEILIRNVGIGCDQEFYKLVEVLFCRKHLLSHAHLYSRRTDSWRDLGGLDQQMRISDYINLSCNDGQFAHWYARTPSGPVILTFDMKSEVFRTAKMPDSMWEYDRYRIVAKDDGYSFILLMLPNRSDELVRIYESSISICEENKGITKLSWNHVVNLERPLLLPTPTPLPLWRRDCVIIKILDANWKIKLLFYDYSARRFIGCFDACSEFFYYKGTFISP